VPTYEYQCNKCQRVFEVRQRISEPALTTCDACGGEVRRLLSPAPFILKGGGWYVTDYPSEARKQGMNAEKSSASDKSDKTTEKSDTATKADKAGKPAATVPKSDGGAGSTSTSGASSPASKPAD
jgi:putative FmdB family regulatory protein